MSSSGSPSFLLFPLDLEHTLTLWMIPCRLRPHRPRRAHAGAGIRQGPEGCVVQPSRGRGGRAADARLAALADHEGGLAGPTPVAVLPGPARQHAALGGVDRRLPGARREAGQAAQVSYV